MNSEIEYECELKQTFNNSSYYVRALSKDTTLYVEVEQINNGYKWKNQFINSYVEEMTSKTGNFKTFDKFCRMIYSALKSNNNGTVFIDLLSYQDLEILKARKAAKAGIEPQQTLNATHRTRNKRYLILTYVVEFDRVHYPLALKLDESSTKNKNNKNKNNKRCATETARQLLQSSISSSNSSSSTSLHSSLTSSPQSSTNNNNNNNNDNQHPNNIQSKQIENKRINNIKKHYRSTPNLNNDDNTNANNKQNINKQQQQQSMTSYQSPKNKNISNDALNNIIKENMALKRMLTQRNNKQQHQNDNDDDNDEQQQQQRTKEQYPSGKLTDIIEVLEDEIKILKQELEKKNLEIRRISRSTKQYQEKHISKRLDDLEDEIERLSTELLQQRTKYRKCNREFHVERQEFNKKIETLEASNEHYKRKCRQLKDQLNTTKKTLENVRLKASKQRLYQSTKSLHNNSSTSLHGRGTGTTSSRSRSRKTKNNNKNKNKNRYQLRERNRNNNYNLNRSTNSNISSSSYRQRSRSSNKPKYQRSSSAPRFSKKRSLYGSRSRSPSVRFDPTAWAKQKKERIERAKLMRNTFGKSRSPSPFRRTSRSASPNHKRLKSKGKNKKKNYGNRKRDRSNSRKRNSFGTTISRSPKLNRRGNNGRNNKKKLPIPRNNDNNYNDDISTTSSIVNDENYNDLNVLNTMEKRKQRILSLRNHGNNNVKDIDNNDDDDDDDDDESSFNPTKEIESIDSRLNALQKFLRAAKSSS